ncbi:MAG: fasciclin domain-containing protein [Muribaculaceae bacterium]|nr:fasciclin domain-containing protein [Muribaculaceae bacterium]
MKIIHKILSLPCLLAVACGLTSCSDEFDEGSLYTLTADTVASYIEGNDDFSTMARLMNDTGTRGLLSTYGHYTCFLPTNSAFDRFFNEYSLTYDTMSDDEKLELMYNHIIMSGSTDYTSDTFQEGALPSVSMSSQKINISYRTSTDGSSYDIMVNDGAAIVERDIEAHNGVLHIIDNILFYPDEYIADILAQHSEFSLFRQALVATGVNTLVASTYDTDYVPSTGIDGFKDPSNPAWDPYFVPQEKRVAYTCFAETDDVFAAKGVTSLADLVTLAEKYYGTADRDNYTSENNALNKFVRYHILDRQLSANEFFFTTNTVPSRITEVEEFYPTLLKDRLIEMKNRQGGVINFRNYPTDLSRVPAYVTISETNRNITAINAYIHAIEDVLVYDEDVMRNDVLNRRLRFDIVNLIPEASNNNYRWNYQWPGFAGVKLPGDGTYTEWFTCTESTRPYIVGPYTGSYHNLQFYVRGWFDYTIKTLPVPPGEWELRIGATMHDYYGIAQIFIDGEIQGIPIDLAAGTTANDLRVGWEEDGATLNIDNDKAMRNRGYMKGPHSEFASSGKTMREKDQCLRIIAGRFTANEYGSHYFRSKNIYSDEKFFVIEYLELIPTSQIENEDVY